MSNRVYGTTRKFDLNCEPYRVSMLGIGLKGYVRTRVRLSIAWLGASVSVFGLAKCILADPLAQVTVRWRRRRVVPIVWLWTESFIEISKGAKLLLCGSR